MLSAFARKKGKGKSGPNLLDEFDQEGENAGDLKKGKKNVFRAWYDKYIRFWDLLASIRLYLKYKCLYRE